MRIPIVLLAAALAAAGCLGGNDPSGSASPATPSAAPAEVVEAEAEGGIEAEPAAPAAPRVARFHLNGTIVAGAAGFSLGDGDNFREFPIRPGAVLLVAELTWNASTSDLDPVVISPHFCPGSWTTQAAWGLDCALVASATRAHHEGWFHHGGGQVGAPDSPARLELSGDELAPWNDCGTDACMWTAFVHPHAVVEETAFTYLVEVTYPPAS